MGIFRKIRRASASRLNGLANLCGYAFVDKKSTVDFFLHEYSSYSQYRDIQVFHNHQKINSIWADKLTMQRVADIARNNAPSDVVRGVCHGSRNGFEQKFLNDLNMGFDVIGTDISETALDYDHSVQWDFHDINSEWVGAFDFVYTNSLDQSWQPKTALTTWLAQLNATGVLIIEHTEEHGPIGASEMDPFGVKPTVVPYVLTMWFGDQISITHSVEKKENNPANAWLFVVSKNVPIVRPLEENQIH